MFFELYHIKLPIYPTKLLGLKNVFSRQYTMPLLADYGTIGTTLGGQISIFLKHSRALHNMLGKTYTRWNQPVFFIRNHFFIALRMSKVEARGKS